MPTRDVVLSFVEAINAHDVARIVGLSSAHHQFIDAHGAVIPVQQLLAAWSALAQVLSKVAQPNMSAEMRCNP